MFLPAGEGIVRFKYSLTGDPELMFTTIGFKGEAAQTAAGLEAGAAEVELAWRSKVIINAANLWSGWSYLGADWQGNVQNLGVIGGSIPQNIVGTAAGETLPQNCALLVRKTTLAPGRWNRGRMYLPAAHLNEVDVSKTGLLAAALVTSIQTRLDQFQNDVAIGPAAVLRLHHATATHDAVDITGLVVQPQIATQRRRLRA